MTTPSPKLGLALPTTVDQFSTADIKANWEKVDSAPGSYICTSSTRPAWTGTQAGRKIYETNTGLEWVWNGTSFVRLNGTGLLKKSDGTWAIGERTTDFSTTSNSMVKVVSVTSVVVPAGNRPIKVEVSVRQAKNAAGSFHGAIYRSNTSNSGPKQVEWNFGTNGSDNNAGGFTYFSIERNGLPAGTYDFSLQIEAPSGTSTLSGTVITPISIFVTEL